MDHAAGKRRFGVLCARLSADGGPLAEAGPMRDLAERIVAEVRLGRPPAELTGDLDALEDLLLRAGYTAGLSDVRSVAPPLPGLGGGHPQLEVFACPGETCLRVAPLSADVPACRVLDRPLRRLRLGS
ncbi:hypothetical protein [Amycolatopsis sp. SID8362]|uniref:hypothetical protein n=1 Tax=Amycolatopsis sp. SID8362 TaxID=2690346 RepID=UPI0013703F79|nr:hypothetical protein [Amycolatopsis sp. SID8362]NBH05547.1 hypothetical protein [Amycolatopsis sp. SID8362]NED42247.1 hypothetical protein [Amycolatopsis sp. SID8362]